ncbi:helix-turn-helix transcriptional regulator [Paenibacillus sp. JNUCC31]|uniref:TetR/AcrR family transcriptional regulator n=1 Tax=Paenibacillus sp. JNUCC-31 TaxID=2777983 RepID=UPI001782B796|nr:helix-turn-helix domain-containing protein [Paenibacillus sp. JNUCC-31]QOS79159.1 helix-turn-helix transcriptional regulator [Paenibacillus sp. JNUCC-31]
MTPRTKEQNEEIRLRRLAQIRRAAADVFLKKGPLLEIRDVAAQAGLGYGTVYHYYSNKGDLLHDLLWDALERASGWLEQPRTSASGEASVDGYLESVAADFKGGSRETTNASVLGPVAVASVRLLQIWAEDHALYLLHKLAIEGFSSLPEARSTTLSAAFHQEMIVPFATLLETGLAVDHAATSDENAGAALYLLQRAEMLLAALVGCASLSLRRGKLHEEARDIVLFLKL